MLQTNALFIAWAPRRQLLQDYADMQVSFVTAHLRIYCLSLFS